MWTLTRGARKKARNRGPRRAAYGPKLDSAGLAMPLGACACRHPHPSNAQPQCATWGKQPIKSCTRQTLITETRILSMAAK
jgi:hypothetical protein